MDTFLLCAGNDTKHAGFLGPPCGQQLILTVGHNNSECIYTNSNDAHT